MSELLVVHTSYDPEYCRATEDHKHIWSEDLREDHMGGHGVYCLKCDTDMVSILLRM